jgi:magnesium-transporting ATPase (P-type)
LLGRAAAACSTAELEPTQTGKSRGEATEIGKLEAARALGVDIAVARREHRRRKLYRFDPTLRLMSTVDEREDGGVHAKGAPEEVLARSTMIGGPADHVPLEQADREQVLHVLERYASRGLRVLARRRLPPAAEPPTPGRKPSASSACSGSSACSIRRGQRLRTLSHAATPRASGSSSSPATTG